MRQLVVVLSLCLSLSLLADARVKSAPELAPPACPGDVNRDGTVDLFDLVAIALVYDQGHVASDQRTDINGDGTVNLIDLVLVARSFGTSYSQAAIPLPTSPPKTQVIPTVRVLPSATATPVYAPRPCCKYCSKGKACGNSCIARNKVCHQPPGCACDR